MRITHTAASPKAGITEHIDNITGRVLVASGLAVEQKYTSYADFLGSANPPAVAPTVEWGVKLAGAYTPATIIKRTSAGELTHYRTPPPDCPLSIVAQFKQLTDRAEEPPLGPDEAKFLEAVYRPGDSGKHRPVCIGKNEKGEPVYVNDFLTRN